MAKEKKIPDITTVGPDPAAKPFVLPLGDIPDYMRHDNTTHSKGPGGHASCCRVPAGKEPLFINVPDIPKIDPVETTPWYFISASITGYGDKGYQTLALSGVDKIRVEELEDIHGAVRKRFADEITPWVTENFPTVADPQEMLPALKITIHQLNRL